MNKTMKHIPLAIGHPVGTEQQYIKEAFDTNWIAPLGPHCDAFENTLKEYIGMPFAFATSSGTAAIHLALIDAGVKRGDTVISSDMTFAATCNPAAYLGANLVFVDSNEETFNMDVKSLELALQAHPETKAVLLVHLYGHSADLDPIRELCDKYHCVLIEDAAEALGSTYKGKMCGSYGDYSILSFNGNKIITTSGGGMVFTRNQSSVDHIKKLATQARDPAPWYQHSEIGYNYRLSNVCAAIGRGQFLDLGNRLAKKRAIYNRYLEGLNGTDAYMMKISDYCESNCWLSIMLIKPGVNKSPFDLYEYLKQHDVETRPIWKPMHMQPVYQHNEFFSINQSHPMDEDIFNRGLCLPSDITENEVLHILVYFFFSYLVEYFVSHARIEFYRRIASMIY